MGRKSFTFDSLIEICSTNFEKVLAAFNVELEDGDDWQDLLTDHMCDLGWELDSTEKSCIRFKYLDNFDCDFNWDEFEVMAPFLAEDSFYEETGGDGGFVYGGYVGKNGVNKRLYELKRFPCGMNEKVLVNESYYPFR